MSLPPPEIQRLRDRVLAETEEPRVYAALLGIFAGLALVLATVGVYGVTAYIATRRMHELGIRTALGATPLRLMRQTLAPIAVVTLLGAGLGIAGALGLTRTLEALLYEVQPGDPITLGLAGLLLLATTLAAACAVARRAAQADPTLALKAE